MRDEGGRSDDAEKGNGKREIKPLTYKPILTSGPKLSETTK